MALDKDKIHDLVEIFYQKPPFKTFYVNSLDGENFVKPIGVFVSLGITTSPRVLNEIKEILCQIPDLTARVAEIQSTRVAGQFMNYVLPGDTPGQYTVEPESVLPSIVLGKESATAELNHLSETSPGEAVKLREIVERIEGSPTGWSGMSVMKLPGDSGYRVFHKTVNYKREGDHEYRLGIYVEEIDPQ